MSLATISVIIGLQGGILMGAKLSLVGGVLGGVLWMGMELLGLGALRFFELFFRCFARSCSARSNRGIFAVGGFVEPFLWL